MWIRDRLETVTQERDNIKTQYDTAKSTLEGFEGKDFDAIKMCIRDRCTTLKMIVLVGGIM